MVHYGDSKIQYMGFSQLLTWMYCDNDMKSLSLNISKWHWYQQAISNVSDLQSSTSHLCCCSFSTHPLRPSLYFSPPLSDHNLSAAKVLPAACIVKSMKLARGGDDVTKSIHSDEVTSHAYTQSRHGHVTPYCAPFFDGISSPYIKSVFLIVILPFF